MIKLKKIQNISVSLHANITVYFKFSTQYFYCFRDPGSFQDRCVWWVDCLSALLWFGWVWCSNHHALWRVLHLCCKYTIKGLASTLYTLYTARLIMGPVRSDSCDKQTAPATDWTITTSQRRCYCSLCLYHECEPSEEKRIKQYIEHRCGGEDGDVI